MNYDYDKNYDDVMKFINNISDINILKNILIEIIENNYDEFIENYIYENYIKE